MRLVCRVRWGIIFVRNKNEMPGIIARWIHATGENEFEAGGKKG